MRGLTISVVLVVVSSCVLGALAGGNEFGQPLFPDSEFIDLISRDSEPLPSPIDMGHHKYITGGAGEGYQQLHGPEASFEHREEVKSDSMLPSYCEPPNPCPVGFSGTDGCLEDFENTADFSRNYQAQQQCLCDQEHMFNCPSKTSTEEYEQGLEEMLAKNGLHKGLIAKKFHETRAEEPRRRKRSVEPLYQQPHHKPNPYMAGPHLRTVKKNGKLAAGAL